MTSARFELVEINSGPRTVLELRGEIDATNAASFDRALADRIAAGPLILDLSPAGYFDSAGFEVLDRILATGAITVVISPAAVLRRAASLMGVPFHDTVDQAGATHPKRRNVAF